MCVLQCWAEVWSGMRRDAAAWKRIVRVLLERAFLVARRMSIAWRVSVSLTLRLSVGLCLSLCLLCHLLCVMVHLVLVIVHLLVACRGATAIAADSRMLWLLLAVAVRGIHVESFLIDE